MVADYNHRMGGVDVTDQYLCYYGIAKKTSKWWKHIAFRLLDTWHNCECLHNLPLQHQVYYGSTTISATSEKLAIPLIESKAQIAVPRTSVNQFTRLMGKHSPKAANSWSVSCLWQPEDKQWTEKEHKN